MNVVFKNSLFMMSSLDICRKGEGLIHTPLYPNLQVSEGELNNNFSYNFYWLIFILFYPNSRLRVLVM